MNESLPAQKIGVSNLLRRYLAKRDTRIMIPYISVLKHGVLRDCIKKLPIVLTIVLVSVGLSICIIFLLFRRHQPESDSLHSIRPYENTIQSSVTDSEAIIADHTSTTKFDDLYADDKYTLSLAATKLHVFYGHTSHGSQVLTGMDILKQVNTQMPRNPNITEYDGDLGTLGDLSWADVTRGALQKDTSINVVMWSWCGGVSENTEDGIQTYLNAMDSLEDEYPSVTFIYMTGHTDGTKDDTLLARNNQIRRYCREKGKILYDFADIERWDPDGNYYPYTSDSCEWCDSWCRNHPCPDCEEECAHSHCFNCYNKGKAFWWLLGKIVPII